jgi:hypothetical protein
MTKKTNTAPIDMDGGAKLATLRRELALIRCATELSMLVESAAKHLAVHHEVFDAHDALSQRMRQIRAQMLSSVAAEALHPN